MAFLVVSWCAWDEAQIEENEKRELDLCFKKKNSIIRLFLKIIQWKSDSASPVLPPNGRMPFVCHKVNLPVIRSSCSILVHCLMRTSLPLAMSQAAEQTLNWIKNQILTIRLNKVERKCKWVGDLMGSVIYLTRDKPYQRPSAFPEWSSSRTPLAIRPFRSIWKTIRPVWKSLVLFDSGREETGCYNSLVRLQWYHIRDHMR